MSYLYICIKLTKIKFQLLMKIWDSVYISICDIISVIVFVSYTYEHPKGTKVYIQKNDLFAQSIYALALAQILTQVCGWRTNAPSRTYYLLSISFSSICNQIDSKKIIAPSSQEIKNNNLWTQSLVFPSNQGESTIS